MLSTPPWIKQLFDTAKAVTLYLFTLDLL